MKRISLLVLFVLGVIGAAVSQNVTYSPLYNGTTFDNKNIVTSLPVGSTPGAGNVSNGVALYSIPIAVPPGTNGVVPSVSIDYNSQVQGGIAGMGWSITGLSAITRTGRNFYYDGVAGQVELSANDRFALDGVRLMLKGGTYGAASSTYGTETEDFATITAIGTQGGGPLSFEILTKGGIKMEFGKTTDSRFMSQTGNTVMFWRLNKVTHPDGNYIEYVYTDTSTERDSRISEIRYTGSAGFAPYNKIEFAYKIRQEAAPGTFSDIRTTYEAGSSIVYKYLLDLITVKADGAVAKKYQFAYGHNDVNSFLKSVTESGSDNSTLNPTIFKYGDVPTEITTGTTIIPWGPNIVATGGDFNGDGKQDILSANQTSTTLGIPYFNSFRVFKADATGSNYSELAYQTLPTGHTVVNKIEIPNSSSFIPNDFTGDGLDDVLTLNISNNATESKLENVTIYASTNGGTSFTANIRAIQPNFFRIPANNRFFYPGDFDGDGIAEYLTILGNTVGTYSPFLCSNYRTPGACGAVSISGTATYPVNTWYNSDDIRTLDFNSDGKTDLMLVKNNVCEIFTFSGSVASRIYSGTFTGSNSYRYLGDFNGDGKTDVIHGSPDFSSVTKLTSTGTSFDPTPLTLVKPWPQNQIPVDQLDRLIIGDYNGDGKSDIYYRWTRVMHYPTSEGYNIHTFNGTDIYYSQGNTFKYKQLTYDEQIQTGSGRLATITYIDDAPLDLNGDGRTDLVSSGGTQLTYKLFNKDGKNNLLHKVSNGLDHVTEWNYKSLVGNGSFYTRGTSTPTYPINLVQPTALLVSDFKVPNGIGGTSTFDYSYEGGWLHREGKGFIGFKFIYTKDNTMDTRMETENVLNTTYYTSVPYKTTTYQGISIAVINTTTLTNEFVSPGPKRFWVKTTGVLESDGVTGRIVNTTNAYDNSGNITYSKTDVNSGVETTETTTTYGAFPAGTLNKPTSITVSKTRGGQTPAYTAVTNFGYNSIGQLTSRTEFPSAAKSVETVYGYNATGNLTSTTVKPTGMTDRTTSSVFDAKGRYPESSLNEMSHGSSATYDAKWGKPLMATGVNGQTTTYTYDGFGRPATTSFPGPYILTQTYTWDANTNGDGAVWKSNDAYTQAVPDATQGKPDVTVWYDLLGRQIRTETEGFGGTIIQKQTYDARGNVKTSTQPYKSAETPITTTNSYDPTFYWLTKVDNGPLGATDLTYAYSSGALTLTTSAPTGITTQTTDASGKVIQATDAGGTLSYTYYNHGGLKDVKKDGVIITSNEYDTYGRQTKLFDVNAGNTLYEFDALGQLVSQTNANGGLQTMQYNLLGQIASRTGPEGTASYTYGASNSGGDSKGMVKQITGFAPGNQTNYVYDALGRPSSVVEKIDNVNHTTSYTYNKFGALVTTTYPSGLAVTNIYDSNGFLTHIRNGSTNIYTSGTVNGQGQVLTYSMGNGKSSTNTYVNGFPTKFETKSTPSGPADIQNLSMVWDYQKNNLTSRNDARPIVNKTESFTYDNLSRLTESKVNNVSFLTNYTSNGNIKDKTDAGNYAYHKSKINAVTDVTNPTPIPTSSNPNPSPPIPVAFQQEISYTAFMQPYQIKEGDSGAPYELTYTYGSDYERIQSVLMQGTTTLYKRYYFGAGFEQEIKGGVTRYIQYIASPVGLAAIVVSSGGSHTFHYTYTDHLGSIVTATNNAGTIEAQQNFDAWGRRRSYTAWSLLAPVDAIPDWLYRGYTGHEHLDEFALINMNGRMYDPVVGRMLSADNNVVDPGFTQDFNRYSYARNNPLVYTDPDGQFWHIVIGAAIGGVVNLGVKAFQGKIHNFKDGAIAFGIGAAAGAVTAATGGAASVYATTGTFAGAFSSAAVATASTGVIAGAASGVAGAALGSPILGIGNSIAFGDPYSAKDYGRDLLFGGITGGVAGGILAAVKNKPIFRGEINWSRKFVDTPLGFRLASTWGDDMAARFPDYIDEAGNVHLGGQYTIQSPHQVGAAGEKAVGIIGGKIPIQINGRVRIPDRLTATYLEEVKNVKYQSYTRQLRDFYDYSQQNGLRMILHTRTTTTFSPELQKMISNGLIIRKIIPGL